MFEWQVNEGIAAHAHVFATAWHKTLLSGFMLLQETPPQTPAPSPVSNGTGLFKRIWYYIDYKFTVGNFSVSLTSLAIGIAALLLAVMLSRWIRSFFRKRMEARGQLDAGLQYTLLRLIHYVIITIGVLFAFSTAFNTDLTSLAVLFTALSVGIGFGLQYIAGDIASGFILLFERPVRVNDFISVGSEAQGEVQGKVKSINLRTTNVLTNDRLSVIVPNSKLVNQTLINWSYGDRRARISIHVGVSYSADVELVTRTLLRAAEDVKFVVDDPAPSVQFLQFGDSSLDFRLLVWTANPRRHPSIKSEINYRIWRLFKEEGIEIPFPQRDLHIRSGVLAIQTTEGEKGMEGNAGDEEPD